MMKIPVTSPAVLGRLKNFVKPYDFVLAPIINDVDLDEQTEKPILVTRFTRKSDEWLNATYYNARTGKTCRIILGKNTSPNVVPVRSYRQMLNAYVNKPVVFRTPRCPRTSGRRLLLLRHWPCSIRKRKPVCLCGTPCRTGHRNGVGSEEARFRAGLRPPPKLHVRFSRMQLLGRLSPSGMQEKELIELG